MAIGIKILLSPSVLFVFFGAYHMTWKSDGPPLRHRRPRLAWFCFSIAVCCALGAFILGE